MIVRNKKNGTNILAFKNTSVIIKGGETVDIPALTDFNDITNKADFGKRGWFEIVEKKEIVSESENVSTKEETNLEKAKKEVKEYTSKK